MREYLNFAGGAFIAGLTAAIIVAIFMLGYGLGNIGGPYCEDNEAWARIAEDFTERRCLPIDEIIERGW